MNVVESFKTKTRKQFHKIKDMGVDEIEEEVELYVKEKLEEYDIKADIVDLTVYGSRSRGEERPDSDIDVVVEIDTTEREDSLFNILNEDGLYIYGIRVDINPITAQKSGTLGEYLLRIDRLK